MQQVRNNAWPNRDRKQKCVCVICSVKYGEFLLKRWVVPHRGVITECVGRYRSRAILLYFFLLFVSTANAQAACVNKNVEYMTKLVRENLIGVVPFSLPNDIHIYINLQ